MSDFLSKLNPFYKFVFIIITSTVFAFTRSMWLNVWVFGICLFLLIIGSRPKQWLKGLKFLIPVSIFAFTIFMTGLRFGTEATGGIGVEMLSGRQAGLIMSTRFFAIAGFGLLFALTTNPYDLIKAMQKDAKLPRKFAYGMLCAINLLPHIKNEYTNAKLAFQVRGIKVSAFSIKPVFSMLVNCFRWSETLSIAMHSKGFYEE